MTDLIELTEDQWYEEYQPMLNHFDADASWGGIMFETYGVEQEYVMDMDPRFVWTFGDGDDGGMYIWSGRHFVNRIGYFVTKNPHNLDTVYQISVGIPEYECPNCDTLWEDDAAVLHDEIFSDLQKCSACASIEELRDLGAIK